MAAHVWSFPVRSWPIAPFRRCTGANPSGQTGVDPFLPVASGSYRVVRNAVRLKCHQRLNQAALAGLARKARTPSMKASTCGSVPMVTRHQFS
jgi:hypothetical protein